MSMSVANSNTYLDAPSQGSQGCWSVRNSLEKKLIFLLVPCSVLCVVFFVWTIALGVRIRNEPDGVEGNEDLAGICGTKVCREIASTFKNAMDTSVKPCDDFYTYACGNFLKNTPVPKELEQNSTLSQGDEILNKAVKDILTNQMVSDDDSTAMATAIRLYRKCLENQTPSGKMHLRDILNDLVGGWPMMNQNWKMDDFQWQQSMAKIIRKAGLNPLMGDNPLLSVAVLPNPDDRTKYIAVLLPAGVTLTLLNVVREDINTYQQHFTQSDAKDKFRKIVCFLNPDCAKLEPQLTTDIDELVNYLSRNSQSYATTRNKSFILDDSFKISSVNQITSYSIQNEALFSMQQLQAHIPQVNWDSFFTTVFSETEYVVKNDFRVMTDIPQLKATVQKHVSIPNQRLAANYFGHLLIYSWGALLSENVREILFPQLQRSDLCYPFINDVMGFAVGRLFIDKHLSNEHIEEATGMMNDLNAAFSELVEESQWMDAQTKAMALKKVKNMVGSVAAPDWALKDDEINAYYNKITLKQNISKGNFGEVFQVSRSLSFEHLARRLTTQVDRRNDWIPNTPVDTNAYYLPLTNSMYFPLGFLRGTAYTLGRPRAVNYGGLGYIAGHEITHGFDARGKNYDEFGHRKDWWSQSSEQKFFDGAGCFIFQYSAIKNELTGKNLNGSLTLSENIADNGGSRAAFRAYKKISQQQGGRLKGLEEFSEDQLFFISAGHTWCTQANSDYIKSEIETSVHSPSMYRPVVPFQNLPEFSSAFKCEPGSFMNPYKKCKIW